MSAKVAYNPIFAAMADAMLAAHAGRVAPVAEYMQTVSELRPNYRRQLEDAERLLSRAFDSGDIAALSAALNYHGSLADKAARMFGVELEGKT